MEDLFCKLKSIADQHQVAYFGVADLEPPHVKKAVLEQGGGMLEPFTRCISMGIAMFGSIVDLLPRVREDRAVAVAYRHHSYDVLNMRLDMAASAVASAVQAAGFPAMPLPASLRVSDEKIAATFSHKLGARQAGFGWIGRSCMLITPDRGPRVRWVSVLADAPLAPTGSPMRERCGDCTACVDICPVHAYTGRGFVEGEPREMRFDAKKCEQYHGIKKEGKPEESCGLCVYVCPYGKKR